MHLFVCEYQQQWATVTVSDTKLCRQLRQVLRMKSGATIMLQSCWSSETTRLHVTIQELTQSSLVARVLSQEVRQRPVWLTSVYVAMPNKPSKLELLCQKLTEIGIDAIVVRSSERSQHRTLSANKLTRLQRIIHEAVEQSHWRYIPSLVYQQSVELIAIDSSDCFYVADFGWTSAFNVSCDSSATRSLLVGPEGWLTDNDYAQRWIDRNSSTGVRIISFGDSVLRMETAAIVGARWLKNSNK